LRQRVRKAVGAWTQQNDVWEIAYEHQGRVV